MFHGTKNERNSARNRVYIGASAIVLVLIMAGQSWAVTAEEGQAIFDGIFWHVLSCFVMGLSAGLAIKLINRS